MGGIGISESGRHVCWYGGKTGQVQVIDISDPVRMKLVASASLPNHNVKMPEILGVKCRGDLIYIAAGRTASSSTASLDSSSPGHQPRSGEVNISAPGVSRRGNGQLVPRAAKRRNNVEDDGDVIEPVAIGQSGRRWRCLVSPLRAALTVYTFAPSYPRLTAWAQTCHRSARLEARLRLATCRRGPLNILQAATAKHTTAAASNKSHT